MLGTLINAAAVIIGSCVGLLLNQKLPDRIVRIVFQAIGLFTIFLGVKMAFEGKEMLIMIVSLVVGSIVGEAINIEAHMSRFAGWIKARMKLKSEKFAEGFVTSFLLFCVGSLTILGAIEEGIGGEPDLLVAKSVMDGCSSIALSAAMGIGVLFSVIPLLLYQGGLTLFAESMQPYLSDPVIAEMTAVGGVLLVGLGINILEIKKLRILNMIPALVVAVVIAYGYY